MRYRALLAIAVGVSAASVARGDPVASLTYDDLSASYRSATQIFTAQAVNNAFLQSSGDTARVVPTPGNATFAPGFVSRGVANYLFTMSVVPTGPFSATGIGSLTITDATGDTITGLINGTWGRPAPGFIFFNGTLNGVRIQSADGRFDGEQGSWDVDLPGGPVYDGMFVNVVFGGSTFFTGDFNNRAVTITAMIVPPPGVWFVIAGAMMMRRRARA